eukprot:362553-Chlamydomonas_euryale.AAC.2
MRGACAAWRHGMARHGTAWCGIAWNSTARHNTACSIGAWQCMAHTFSCGRAVHLGAHDCPLRPRTATPPRASEPRIDIAADDAAAAVGGTPERRPGVIRLGLSGACVEHDGVASLAPPHAAHRPPPRSAASPPPPRPRTGRCCCWCCVEPPPPPRCTGCCANVDCARGGADAAAPPRICAASNECHSAALACDYSGLKQCVPGRGAG